MKKYKNINILILDDNDMNCDSKKDNINTMSLGNVGFSMLTLEEYDIVVYEGKKGSKILKSKYTKKGLIS